MILTLRILDLVLFIGLGLPALYLFVFALFSMRRRRDPFPPASKMHRFAVVIPAYKGDDVIGPAIEAALAQEYPRDRFEVVVVADKFRPESLRRLAALPIRLLVADFAESSKARALNLAAERLGPDAADLVAILDVDNIAAPAFLRKVNEAFCSGAGAVQGHRKALNTDTDTALLDAASEEINNAIFRRGHVALGLSSALIGSGMAFDHKWFCEHIGRVSTAGEDKELEALLLRERIYIEYLDDAVVYDEKVRSEANFYNQRRRWLAAQAGSLARAVRDLPGAVLSGNLDYIDKLVQWMMPPRILLLGLIPLLALLTTLVATAWCVKWWVALLLLLFALAFALPDELMDERLKRALRRTPVLFLLMAANLFRLRGVNRRFIHTEHGKTEVKP